MIRTLLLLLLLARAAVFNDTGELTEEATNTEIDSSYDGNFDDGYDDDGLRKIGTDAPSSDANEASIEVLGEFDYCSLNASCPSGTLHTMCQYKDEKPGVKCGGPLDVKKFLTAIDKKKILKQHNVMRGKINQGNVKGQPAATHLEPFVWDEELEMIARRWAVQCLYVHATCRLTRRHGYEKQGEGVYGQNIAILASQTSFGNRYAAMVHKWFDEHKLFPDSKLAAISSDREGASYTQIVWASTKRLGCERVVYNRSAAESVYDGGAGEGMTELLVCNYGPAGNWVGEQVYAEQVSPQPRRIYVGDAGVRAYEIGSARMTTCGGPVITSLCVFLTALFQTTVY